MTSHGDRRVQALELRVGLVLRVPVPVLGERLDLVADVLAHAPRPRRALVQVVAEEDHEVDVLRVQMPVRAEEPDLEVLASRREP